MDEKLKHCQKDQGVVIQWDKAGVGNQMPMYDIQEELADLKVVLKRSEEGKERKALS